MGVGGGGRGGGGGGGGGGGWGMKYKMTNLATGVYLLRLIKDTNGLFK